MSDIDLDTLLDAKMARHAKKGAYGGWIRVIILLAGLVGVKFAPVGESADVKKGMEAMWAEIHNCTNRISEFSTNLAVMQRTAELTQKAHDSKLEDHEARLRSIGR